MAGFTFNYTKYESPTLSVGQLDGIAALVFSPEANSNIFSRIMSILLLVAALAYIYVRSKMVDQQQAVEKQQYEAAQSSADQSAVNNQDPVHK